MEGAQSGRVGVSAMDAPSCTEAATWALDRTLPADRDGSRAAQCPRAPHQTPMRGAGSCAEGSGRVRLSQRRTLGMLVS